MVQYAKLNSGHQIPLVGFGTWQAKPKEVEVAVEEALRAGYLHLDLAKIYQNQEEVREGMKKSGVAREKIFITSKLWNNCHRPELVEGALDDTLQELGLDYLDLYLVHWPVAFDGTGTDLKKDLFPKGEEKNGSAQVKLDLTTSLVDTWKAMIKLLDTGKVRSIGVSNFSLEAIDVLIKETGVTPAAHQVERHPLLLQEELIAHHQKAGIHVQGYSPLCNNSVGDPLIIENDDIKAIAKEVGATPAQVAIAWAQVGGHSVLPKSVTPSRIQSNVQEIKPLSDEQMERINALGKGDKRRRYNVPFNYKPQWDINVFGEESESSATHKVKIQ